MCCVGLVFLRCTVLLSVGFTNMDVHEISATGRSQAVLGMVVTAALKTVDRTSSVRSANVPTAPALGLKTSRVCLRMGMPASRLLLENVLTLSHGVTMYATTATTTRPVRGTVETVVGRRMTTSTAPIVSALIVSTPRCACRMGSRAHVAWQSSKVTVIATTPTTMQGVLGTEVSDKVQICHLFLLSMMPCII